MLELFTPIIPLPVVVIYSVPPRVDGPSLCQFRGVTWIVQMALMRGSPHQVEL